MMNTSFHLSPIVIERHRARVWDARLDVIDERLREAVGAIWDIARSVSP